MHLALACTARARWRAQCELSPRLAAADSARGNSSDESWLLPACIILFLFGVVPGSRAAAAASFLAGRHVTHQGCGMGDSPLLRDLPSLREHLLALPPRRVVVLSQGSTATSAIYRVLCDAGLAAVHFHHHCNMTASSEGIFVPASDTATREALVSALNAHKHLVGLYKAAIGCVSAGCAVDACRWESQLSSELSAVGAAQLSLSDGPYANAPFYFLRSHAFRGSVFLLSRRTGHSWARSRRDGHGGDPICADTSGGGLDLAACARRCCSTNRTRLSTCFVALRTIDPERLAALFDAHQKRVEEAYAPQGLVQLELDFPRR